MCRPLRASARDARPRPRSSSEPPRASSSSIASTSASSSRSSPHWASRNARRSARGQLRGVVKERLDPLPALGVDRARSLSHGALSSDRRSSLREPGSGGPPVAEDRRLGDVEQRRGLAHVQPAEEAALDHHRLARIEPGELLERGVEREQLRAADGAGCQRLRRRSRTRPPAAALARAPAPRGLDQHLAHGAGGDPLEMRGGTAAPSAARRRASPRPR